MGVTSMFCPGQNRNGCLSWMGFCLGTWIGFSPGPWMGHMDGAHGWGFARAHRWGLPGHMDGGTYMDGVLPGHMDVVLPRHMDRGTWRAHG